MDAEPNGSRIKKKSKIHTLAKPCFAVVSRMRSCDLNLIDDQQKAKNEGR